jgi:hypothetical protein
MSVTITTVAKRKNAVPGSANAPASEPVMVPQPGAEACTDASSTPTSPCKLDVGWRKIIRNFTPS